MKFNQLEEFLDEDLGWRKIEISSLILIAEEKNQDVLLKSIILLLYAHWEGFIKKSSKTYLKYISEQKYDIGDLGINFMAVAIKSNISKCISSKESINLSNELSFIDKFERFQTQDFKVHIDIDNDQDKAIIDTQSNLNPEVFKNILQIIGLNYKTQIETKEKYIENYMLKNRNLIAHGSKFKKEDADDFSLEIIEIKKLREIIFLIMENVKEELLEYAKNEYYKKSNIATLTTFLQEQEEKLEKTFKEIDSKYE